MNENQINEAASKHAMSVLGEKQYKKNPDAVESIKADFKAGVTWMQSHDTTKLQQQLLDAGFEKEEYVHEDVSYTDYNYGRKPLRWGLNVCFFIQDETPKMSVSLVKNREHIELKSPVTFTEIMDVIDIFQIRK